MKKDSDPVDDFALFAFKFMILAYCVMIVGAAYRTWFFS